jgi:hypothetical protein
MFISWLTFNGKRKATEETKDKGTGTGKVHPKTGHEGPEWE